MREALGLTDNQMGLIQGPALSIPVLLAAVPLGILIDRWSRVRLLLIFAISNFFGSLLTAKSPGFLELIVARGVVGLTGTATFTCALSLVGDFYAPEKRGRATMFLSVSQIIGTSAAFAMGGVLLASSWFGHNDWRWVMSCLTIPLFGVVILALALREPDRSQGVTSHSASNARSSLYRHRHVIVPLLAGMAMTETALGAVLVWTAPMLSRKFALPPDRVGLVVAAGLVTSGVLGPIAGGTVADVCQRNGGPGRTVVTLSTMLLLVIPSALFSSVPPLWATILLFGIFTTGVSAATVMGTTLFTIAIPDEVRGLCMALMSGTSILFAGALAPLVVSELTALFGGPGELGFSLSIVGIGACGLATLAFWFVRRSLTKGGELGCTLRTLRN